jgi:hypothetical protein
MGRRLSDAEPLVTGASYSLHVQIQPRRAEDQDVAADDQGKRTTLCAMLYAPKADFAYERAPQALDLPHRGVSSQIFRPIQPLRSGERQIRACIYYGNVLLQSAVLNAAVVQPGERVAGGAIARQVDYVASADLADLGQLPQPDVSLFTNQTADGTHWIGAYATGEIAALGLRSGELYTYDPADLQARAGDLRRVLVELDDRAEFLEDDLVRLAGEGYKLYHHLFEAYWDYEEQGRLDRFEAALARPCVISVANCRPGRVSMPWAALYQLHLERGMSEAGLLRLCHVYAGRLSRLQPVAPIAQDWWDHPEVCHARDDCPLRQDDTRSLTVCPFGFWGLLHQIEQPLQHVHPSQIERVPDEVKRPGFGQTARIESAETAGVRLAACVGPDLDNADEHRRELVALQGASRLDVQWRETRAEVMDLLRARDYELYYFYCHGDVEGRELKLRMLGPANALIHITASDLDRRQMDWPKRPLVIVNACESMAMTPDVLNDFMRTLRSLGASGVVGTEVQVRTTLAHEVGRRLIAHLLAGRSIGEAVLEVRRSLLDRHNPQGLIYTYYAPAALHLHEGDGCRWCRLQPRGDGTSSVETHMG